jgi:hypothetical protein
MLRRVALVRTTRRNISEDTILHSHRRGNLKSYKDQYILSFKFLVRKQEGIPFRPWIV